MALLFFGVSASSGVFAGLVALASLASFIGSVEATSGSRRLSELGVLTMRSMVARLFVQFAPGVRRGDSSDGLLAGGSAPIFQRGYLSLDDKAVEFRHPRVPAGLFF